MVDEGRQKLKARSPKERVVQLLTEWLKSDELAQNLVIKRMQVISEKNKINADNFYHWYQDTTRPVHTNPENTLTLLRAIRELKSTKKRFKAAEVIEFCDLTQFPISRFQEVQQLYGTQEWKKEWEEAIKLYIPNHSTSVRYQTNLGAVPVTVDHGFPSNKEDANLPDSPQVEADKLLKAHFQGFSSARFWNVPHQRNHFFTGREALLQYLHETLNISNTEAPTPVLKAIRGMGGIGKTQTATEYAYRYRLDYETVLWVKADTRENLLSDFMEIAMLLDLPEAKLLELPEKDEKVSQRVVDAAKDWLEDHSNWLLIFDNADDPPIVRDFLPQFGRGHILLTTRASAVGRIGATPVEIELMDEDEGTLFLLRRAGILESTAPVYDASGADRICAQTIVQEMEGLPLALEQAGAYIEETSINISQYLNLYQAHRAELLNSDSEPSPDYPYTIATVWSFSFQKVEQANPAAIELLRLCAFLNPDAISEEIIIGETQALDPELGPICSDQLRMNTIVKDLLRFSLIRRNSQTGTLTIHRLIQAVIQDGMDKETRCMWAERAIRAVHHAFPDKVNDVKTWSQCKRCLPHAQACSKLITDYGLVFPEAAQLLNQAGYYLREQARYTEAEEFFLQSLAINEKLGPEHLLYTAQILNNRARVYFDQYNYLKAESLYEQALTIREQKLDPEDPVIAQNLNSLALNYWYVGKYAEADPLYQRARCICEQKLEPKHAQTLYILNNQALLYRSQHKYEDAIKLNQHVLGIREEKLGLEHLDVAQSLQNLAVTYYYELEDREQGEQRAYEEAVRLLKRALAIREKRLPPEHPQIARCLNYLASVYQALGKYKEARQSFTRALEIREKVLGPDNMQTVETKKKYATLLRKMKRDEEAAILEAQIKAIQDSKSS